VPGTLASRLADADELFLSRATYFRRLRTAAGRLADYLVASQSGPAPPTLHAAMATTALETPLLDSRPWRLWVVPHTHWDREWYLPFEDFRIHLVEVIDEVIATLEERPVYRFTLDGQAILIEDYLEIRPEMEGRLRALLAAGQIETGPCYVLPDEFLVGAEALVRNLLHGRVVCERYGARPASVGYLPDSFGHPAQLPQILRGFGLDSFVFSRGLGDERERVGGRFRWRAPDGSEVLALPQPVDYGAASSIGHSVRSRQRSPGANAADRVEQILRAERPMLADPGFRDLFLGNGVDHSHLQDDLPEVLAELRALRPHVEAAIARLSDYTAAIAAEPGEPPSFIGELAGGARLNVLRGVNSSRMYLKQANERCERTLQGAETLCALAVLARPDVRYPLAELRHGWRELLRNHPHDSICGCSVDEVHDDMDQRFRSALQVALRLSDMALHGLGGARPGGDNDLEPHGHDGRYRWAYRPLPGGPVRDEDRTGAASFANVLPFARRRLVALHLPAALAAAPVLSAGGRAVQLDEQARAWVELEVPGFSARDVAVEAAAPARTAEPRAQARGERRIENEHYRVTADDDGSLTVEHRRSGATVRGLHRLEDVADRGDSYTFCPVAGDVPLGAGTTRVRVTAAGPVFAELELATELALPVALADDRLARSADTIRCPVVTRVRLAASGERLELTTTVDNRVRDHRLRVCFPTPETPSLVRAEGHFAVARRDPRPVWNGAWVEPPHDTNHTLGAVAVGGLALYTTGMPEYEVTEDGALALTLLRCVGWLSRGDLSSRGGNAGPQLPVPGAQCPGVNRFAYALELGEPADAELLRRSQDHRFAFVAGRPGVDLRGPLDIDGDVVVTALKGAEDGDGVVLRACNPGTAPADMRLDVGAAVVRCRLDESALGPAPTAIAVGPGEIVTLRLRPSGA
jgi:mannosylglycerate hydrolase